jgi:hypothetical protein
MFIEPFGVRVPFPRFLRLRKVSSWRVSQGTGDCLQVFVVSKHTGWQTKSSLIERWRPS